MACKLGYSVSLLSNFENHESLIKDEGIDTINWKLVRESKNPLKEIAAIFKIVSALKETRPNILHSVALKPVIYSSIACSLIGFNNRVFALAGLGSIFTSKKKQILFIKPVIAIILRMLLNNPKTRIILQNPEDAKVLIKERIVRQDSIRIIRGAGVDTLLFSTSDLPKVEKPIICLPSRMIWAKGILDFIECSKVINKIYPAVRFVLVGAPDDQNPDSIPIEKLKKWNDFSIVEWWGHKDDMQNVYRRSSIICLPTTYGEGLPKSLLEAASCGRPIVTYDVPGCREIVIDGYNGFLVKPKSVSGLVDAISTLLKDEELCTKMGRNGRKLVEKYFTQEKIAKETIAVWEEVLASK